MDKSFWLCREESKGLFILIGNYFSFLFSAFFPFSSFPFPLENSKTCSFVENEDECFHQNQLSFSTGNLENMFIC